MSDNFDIDEFFKRDEEWRKANPEAAKKRAEKAHQSLLQRKAILMATRKFGNDKAKEIKQFFATEPNNNLQAPEVLSRIIEAFDLNEQRVNSLYLEWTIEQYVNRKIAPKIEVVEKVYDLLISSGHIRDIDGKGEELYMWSDNYAFALSDVPEGMKVFCIRTQNLNYVFILTKTHLHIRQYWEVCDTSLISENYDVQDFKGTFADAILKADMIVGRYSDAILGNKYVSRPSLQWFLKKRFNFNNGIHGMYGDGRDVGYIYSYDRPWVQENGEEYEFSELHRERGDVLEIWKIDYALMYLDGALATLTEN